MTVHPVHGVGSPALPGTTPALPGGGGATASPHAAKDLVEVSAGAALLRRLASIANESPVRFRAVATGVAERLATRAATDPQHAGPLTRLAERFAAAAAAGSPAPLAAEPARPGSPPASAGAGSANAAAALAAAAISAGAASQRPAARPLRRAYPRAGLTRPEQGAGGADQPGGFLGALLSSVTGVVEAALEAALLDAPAEAPGEPAGGGPPVPPKGR